MGEDHPGRGEARRPIHIKRALVIQNKYNEIINCIRYDRSVRAREGAQARETEIEKRKCCYSTRELRLETTCIERKRVWGKKRG